MEPPIRLYRPNGSGRPRRNEANPAKRSRVADELDTEPPVEVVPEEPPPAKPTRRGRNSKRGSVAKAPAAAVLADGRSTESPAESSPAAPLPGAPSAPELVMDRPE